MIDLKNWQWQPPKGWRVIKTIDMHTGGEPLRVFIDGVPEIKGKTILEKRRYFRDNFDYIRTGTMWEPRGHADMYGAIITGPPPRMVISGFFSCTTRGTAPCADTPCWP
jgi:proline racemase